MRIINITHKESISFVRIRETGTSQRLVVFNLIKVIKPLTITNNSFSVFPLHFACHVMSNWNSYALTSVSFWGLNMIPEIYWWLHWGAPSSKLPPEDLPIKKKKTKHPGRTQWVGWSARYLPFTMYAVSDETVKTSLEKDYWVRLCEGLLFCLFIQITKRIARDPYVE